ncbi:cytochrome P450 [Streptomyces antimycoticus]|uniref:cytochrome P450 n=1 Tax=Streptomyces antimycoticus TaxID=68175 RepID=UPI0037D97897
MGVLPARTPPRGRGARPRGGGPGPRRSRADFRRLASHLTPERVAGRPKHAYVPFGSGRRVCVGKHFALAELVPARQACRIRPTTGQEVSARRSGAHFEPPRGTEAGRALPTGRRSVDRGRDPRGGSPDRTSGRTAPGGARGGRSTDHGPGCA